MIHSLSEYLENSSNLDDKSTTGTRWFQPGTSLFNNILVTELRKHRYLYKLFTNLNTLDSIFEYFASVRSVKTMHILESYLQQPLI